MSKSIGVFGAGPGLGQAVARRYAAEGYDVVLVARRPEPLEQLAEDLASGGGAVHAITADLTDTAAVPALAEQVRRQAGHLDALYYAPTPDGGFIPAADLTAPRARDYLPLIFYTLVDLVQQFLPQMLERGDGAILTAQGASTVQGLPNMSGPGPAQAAQRNYLQSLHAEVSGKGIYVGMLYIGALIENSAFHTWTTTPGGGGGRDWGPTVDPDHLAALLWSMHTAKGPAEASYPARLRPPGVPAQLVLDVSVLVSGQRVGPVQVKCPHVAEPGLFQHPPRAGVDGHRGRHHPADAELAERVADQRPGSFGGVSASPGGAAQPVAKRGHRGFARWGFGPVIDRAAAGGDGPQPEPPGQFSAVPDPGRPVAEPGMPRVAGHQPRQHLGRDLRRRPDRAEKAHHLRIAVHGGQPAGVTRGESPQHQPVGFPGRRHLRHRPGCPPGPQPNFPRAGRRGRSGSAQWPSRG